MKKSFLMPALIAGAVALIGAGCSSIETNRVGSQVQVGIPVEVQPEIEVGKQVIQGTATVHSILGIFSWGPNTQAIGVNFGVGSNRQPSKLEELFSLSAVVARNAAVYEATTRAKADIILAPQYVLTTKDYFFYKSINCQVKGYPGFIKGVKVVEATPAAEPAPASVPAATSSAQ